MIMIHFPYDWITGSQSAFLNAFRDDDAKLRRAREFWNSLQNCEVWLLIGAIAIGVIFAILYYTWWNKIARPGGYHYRIRHWVGFAVVSSILCFVGSYWLYDFIVVNKTINKIAEGFQLNLSMINIAVCFILYFIISFLWCNWGKTNAYPFLKFRK